AFWLVQFVGRQAFFRTFDRIAFVHVDVIGRGNIATCVSLRGRRGGSIYSMDRFFLLAHGAPVGYVGVPLQGAGSKLRAHAAHRHRELTCMSPARKEAPTMTGKDAFFCAFTGGRALSAGPEDG